MNVNRREVIDYVSILEKIINERNKLKKERDQYKELYVNLRECASDVMDAMCLPGHPFDEAWKKLCLLSGRFCDPFLNYRHKK